MTVVLTRDTSPQNAPDPTEPVGSGPPTPEDGAGIWQLVESSSLDTNSPYAYVLWGDHFAATSRVARLGDEVVGFVMGHRVPDRPDVLFIWQVGIADSQRGCGLASRLLDEVWEANGGLTHLEATVTPTNRASDLLFRSFARRHETDVETSTVYGEDLFPHGQDHEAEVLYRIGPIPAR